MTATERDGLSHTLGGSAATAESLELVFAHGSVSPIRINVIDELGQGRAARVQLSHAEFDDGRQMLVAEKVFSPGFLTRFVYRTAFQATFPYRDVQDAILACFYRRRVAGAIVSAMTQVRVAKSLYVRWDKAANAFVLGTEYISGRGVVPQAIDTHGLRRWIKRFVGLPVRYPDAPPQEIGELVPLMERLEDLFHRCGLVGTGWQVCPRAIVSTANLLWTPNGYVIIDLESGIPAVLAARYIPAGMRLGTLPLFDDLDAPRLRSFIKSNRSRIALKLGTVRFETLERDAERLIAHTDAWKESEPSLGRSRRRSLGHDFRERFKARCIEIWRRRDVVDAESAVGIRTGRNIFGRLVFWLGLIPFGIGRFAQRLYANAPFRMRVARFASDRDFRRQSLDAWSQHQVREWRQSGRIRKTTDPVRFGIGTLAHTVLSKTTPRSLHRFLVDPVARRNTLLRAWLFVVSSRFQSEYGRHLIRQSIADWQRHGRIDRDSAADLKNDLASSALDEYVRCFGMHLGLKLLLPIMAPLKVSGIAAFLGSGNLWFLAVLFLLPLCRTLITLWRMAASGRPATDYSEALWIGALPLAGSLAFPVQMYSRHRELSAFLMRDAASRIGRCLPVYGARDSRVELWIIKSVNYVAELMEIGLSSSPKSASQSSPPIQIDPSADLQMLLPINRWDRLAVEQLQAIAAETADREIANAEILDRCRELVA